MHINKKYLKTRQSKGNKLTKRNNKLTKRNMKSKKYEITRNKKITVKSRRKGGMLRQVGTPVLTAVKTIGTEYAKEQAQKIVTGKRNVLGDITNTYKNKSPITPIMPRTPISNNKYTENDENIMIGIKPRSNINVKPAVTLTKDSYSDFEL